MTFKKEADVPIVDYPESYGFMKRKEMMSPIQFFKLARLTSTGEKGRAMPIKEYIKQTIYDGSVKKAIIGLKSKKALVPTPWLEFRDGYIKEHEGRNRAWAGELVGRKQIPVWFIWKKGDVVPPENYDDIYSYWEGK